MDFLGWYTTGDSPNESDIHVHKQICEINESPVILKLNPFTRNADLPVTMYESVIDLVNGEATMLFVELTYTLATEEAERIGVDHVARMASGDSAESSQGNFNSFIILMKLSWTYFSILNSGGTIASPTQRSKNACQPSAIDIRIHSSHGERRGSKVSRSLTRS